MQYWEVQKMPKATKLEDFINVFSPYPLNNENFEDFFVDTSSVRGNEMRKLEITCMHGNYQYAKMLFSGHMGAGKTTELYNLSQKIKNKYEIINVSILKHLDIYNMSYVDFLFEIMSAILLNFGEKGNKDFQFTNETFSDLYDYWHSEHFITTVFKDEDNAQLESSVNVEGSATGTVGLDLVGKLKFLLKVATKGSGILKTSTETKDELIRKLDLRIGDLITAMNTMIESINESLGEKELMIIVEDLDKADESAVNEIFTKHFTPFMDLHVKMIFNIPIFLEYSLDFKKIKDNMNASFMLQTINVYNSDGTPNGEHIDFFKKLVCKRAEEKFFDDTALEYMIEKSGGILRDLFGALVEAAMNVLIEHPDTERILYEDAESACVKLRNDYVKSIETKKQYDLLIKIYNHESEVFEDADILRLLQANVLIECGEFKEYQVHPLVIDYMKYKGDVDV